MLIFGGIVGYQPLSERVAAYMGNQLNLRLTLDSKTSNLAEIEPFLCRCRSKVGFDDKLYYDILLVLTEAVTNGIQHGNGADPRKKVTIVFQHGPRDCEFSVRDEGRGFDPCTVANPTRGARLTQANGRGVYLMQQLAHRCEFRDNGRTVNLRFNL